MKTTTQAKEPTGKRWIRFNTLQVKLDNLSRSSIYKALAAGNLPKPTYICGTPFWSECEIDAMLTSRREVA